MMKVLISGCFGKILDMARQENEKVVSFFTKRTNIRSLLVALPKWQKAEMEGSYFRQLEQTEALCFCLLSTSEDQYSYVKQKVEAYKKYKFDNISTFQNPSSSVVV